MTAPCRLSITLGCLASVALAGCGGPVRPGRVPRHVILITVEGFRADHSSAYLYERETTSLDFDESYIAAGRALAIDDLAAGGVMFAMIYLGFMLLVAWAKPLLGTLVAPGLSLGLLLGALVIVSAWLLIWIYVRWANNHYDAAVVSLRGQGGPPPEGDRR